jgi:hypothetical protein
VECPEFGSVEELGVGTREAKSLSWKIPRKAAKGEAVDMAIADGSHWAVSGKYNLFDTGS